MTELELFLKEHDVDFTSEDGKVTVGGGLYLRSVTTIPEGFNPTVGGGLYLSSVKTIPDGFNPTVGGGLDLRRGLKAKIKPLPSGFLVKLSLALEARFSINGFTITDNILAKIISKRGSVMKVKIIGKNDFSWIVSDENGNNAHGDTLKQASNELRFKLASKTDRDY